MPLPGGAGFLNRIVSTGIAGRLIPQEGITATKDAFGLRKVRVPYKVLRDKTDSWNSLLPARGDAPPAGANLPASANLVVWDVDVDFMGGKAFVDIEVSLAGTLNGVVPPDRPTVNEFTLQSVQINGSAFVGASTDGRINSESTLDITYYAPQTTYRYVVDDDPLGVSKYSTIENSEGQTVKVVRTSVRGNVEVQPTNTEDGDDVFYDALVAVTVERVQSFRTEKVGNYWCCESVVAKVLKGQFDPG